MNVPVFAVVGHPNKGKSSLVATLARDASVVIGPEPGTTRQTRDFPMRVGNETLYTLIDTPGFQRARAAMDWMRQREAGAASRPGIVQQFVEENSRGDRFQDECALLRPLVNGAGIIYVVDGAAPYGPEYDAEMEILRWSGQPSMAVINTIGPAPYVDEWKNALGQFFRVVRVLDVMQAPFEQRIEVIRAFSQLRDDWREPLEQAVSALIEDRRQLREDAAEIVAEHIARTLTHSESKDIASHDDPARYEKSLKERYHGELRRLERRAREAVESLYGYRDVERRETDIELLETDLLSRESWIAFGLSKRDLVMVGTVSGALVGGAVDVALLGASFLAGSVVGGVLGGTLGYLSSEKLADIKILTQPLGGLRLRYGPTRNIQFPFVLLNRARLHHAVVAGRTHAQRGVLNVDPGDTTESRRALPPLSDTHKRELARLFNTVRKSTPGSQRRIEALSQLSHVIAELFEIPDHSKRGHVSDQDK